MKKSIAILLVAIMALTVVSSAGVVAAQDGHRNVDHGKNFNDQRNRNDRERNRFDCIKLIKIRECVSPNCGAAFN